MRFQLCRYPGTDRGIVSQQFADRPRRKPIRPIGYGLIPKRHNLPQITLIVALRVQDERSNAAQTLARISQWIIAMANENSCQLGAKELLIRETSHHVNSNVCLASARPILLKW
jgi:hypothetical protein